MAHLGSEDNASPSKLPDSSSVPHRLPSHQQALLHRTQEYFVNSALHVLPSDLGLSRPHAVWLLWIQRLTLSHPCLLSLLAQLWVQSPILEEASSL